MIKTNNRVRDIYTLTPLQEGILFHALYSNQKDMYYEQISCYMEWKELDIELAEKSLNDLVQKYEILRTNYLHDVGERSVQVVLNNRKAPFIYEDISHLPDGYKEIIKKYKEEQRSKGFDLATDSLLRLSIYKVDAARYEFVWDFHHIIMDGWCIGVLMNDFLEMYQAACRRQPSQLEVQYPYRNYITWLNNQSMAAARNYWSSYVAGFNTPSSLPQSQSVMKEYAPGRFQVKLEQHECDRLRSFAARKEVTLNSLMQALWAILLSRYNHNPDVVFGAVVSGRNVPVEGIEEMVGLFINTIPVRVHCEQQSSLSVLCKQIQTDALEAAPHHHYPLYEIQSQSDLKNKLFDHIIAFENYPVTEHLKAAETSGRPRVLEVDFYERTNYAFNLVIQPQGEAIVLRAIYDSNHYAAWLIEEVFSHYRSLINCIVDSGDPLIRDMQLIDDAAITTLLQASQSVNEGNEQEQKGDLWQMFTSATALAPERIALVLKDHHMSYGALLQQSRRIGAALQLAGVPRNAAVALRMDRSPEMIIAILGILSAGCGYVPIDLQSPYERQCYMLQQAGASIGIGSRVYKDSLPEDVQWIYVEDILSKELEVKLKEEKGDLSSLAYIMYTSGSTGRPKGISVSHGNVLALVNNSHTVQVKGSDAVMQWSNYAFDGSVFDIFCTLLRGARLVLVPAEKVGVASEVNKLIQQHNINVFFVTAALFNAMVEEGIEKLRDVRLAIVGGEKLSYQHIKKAVRVLGKGKLVNGYGPTETTAFGAFYRIDELDDVLGSIPIGQSLSHTRLYVLAEGSNQLQPRGVWGEICIGGQQVSQGYIGDKELTALKFVEDPFVAAGRMFRSGDIGRQLPDGNIEYLNRRDGLVKVRGFRIELGEIEQAFLKLDGIQQCRAVVRRDALYAYYKSDKPVAETLLRDHLAKWLPQYMIPSACIQVNEFPLTLNGKLDIAALPLQERNNGMQAGTTEAEKRLALIWASLLELDNSDIPVNKNFFEAGGHSLRALRLMNRINEQFNVRLVLTEIFQNPTIRQLATLIKRKEHAANTIIPAASQKPQYVLSSAQKRLFVLYQMNKNSLGYNMPMALALKGALDIQKLNAAINKIIGRHEILRTGFLINNEEPVQVVFDEIKIQLSTFEYHGSLQTILKKFIAPFDLAKAPLLRMGLVKKQENDEHWLLVDMHHIIADGISLQNLVHEFVAVYNDNSSLPELTLQYKDYAEWQQSDGVYASLESQKQYWLQQFATGIPVCDVLYDYDRSPIKNYRGAGYDFNISTEEVISLNRLALEGKGTLYMVMLAVYNVLLSKLSNQHDIVVGTPVSGRSHLHLEPLIGMFVNMLPIRNQIPVKSTFHSFLQQVRQQCLGAFENQDYPFDKLVEQLKIRPSSNRHPLFDFAFHFEHMPRTNFSIPGLSVQVMEVEQTTSKFDLSLHVFETKEGLHCSFEYDTDLFKPETIERITRYFKNLVAQVIQNPKTLVAEMHMQDNEEKEYLLSGMEEPADFPDISITRRFNEMVNKCPDAVAVMLNEEQLTYRDLDRRSSLLAAHLNSKGVSQDAIVGIIAERSIHTVTGILSILKAGAAYLPIDPAYPKERIDFMIRDSNVQFVLKEKDVVIAAPDIIWINIDNNEIFSPGDQPVLTDPATSTCAYVIYTSGTTGKPKGVMINHKNVMRLLVNNRFPFEFSGKDIWTLFHSFSFDFSVWEMFGALLYGGKLVIIPKVIAQQAPSFMKLIKRQQVTVLNQTPAAFYNLIEEDAGHPVMISPLRYIIFGGEALRFSSLLSWKERYPATRLVNMYGITETTVHTTIKEVNDEDILLNKSNIGKPIPTTTTYILGREGELLPAGVTGELYIGGLGVSTGYLNRPELTHEKFIENPYKTNDRLYRSGDLVKQIAGGELEYKGRIDTQVKIRGFRIEPGEIESQLLGYPSVTKAAVVARELSVGKVLCAYYVSIVTFPENELKEYLGQCLPDYMVPAYFIRLDEMPMTANGKVDQKALPEPVINIQSSYVQPTTQLELELVRLVARKLGIDEALVGVESNFMDMGLNSLSLSSLLVDLHNIYNVEISLIEVFQKPDVSQLSKIITESSLFNGDASHSNKKEILI